MSCQLHQLMQPACQLLLQFGAMEASTGDGLRWVPTPAYSDSYCNAS